MSTIFLVLSLFLPRTVLVIFYFLHITPHNNTPFLLDVLLTICFPRALILIFIVDNLGVNSPWFWIHLIAAFMVYFSGGKLSHKKRKKKLE